MSDMNTETVEVTLFNPESVEELVSGVQGDVQDLLLRGFYTKEDLVASAIQFVKFYGEDVADGTGGTATLPEAEVLAIVEAELAKKLDEEAGWPAITDCDRLDAAFENLDWNEVVAVQDSPCCPNCSRKEMREIIDELMEGGADPRGYVFYHSQTTDSAVEGQGVWLCYSACAGTEDREQDRLLGEEIKTSLETAGLIVEWDGLPEHTIHVPLDWKRRQPKVEMEGAQ